MQISQLKPASALAQRYGVKTTIFGGPGSGKTPLCATAPRPVLCVTEPGLLSMRTSNAPVWEAFSVPRIIEFMDWILKSKEAASFDTICIDSLSNVAELILAEEESKKQHGLPAYGHMSKRVMEIANNLYYLQQKNVVMIAKQTAIENGRETVMGNGGITFEPVMQKRPYFPGKDLNIKLPHLFDNVMHLGDAMIAGQPKPVKALRTKEIPEIFSRDRLGNLAELEPADLTALFAKAMI